MHRPDEVAPDVFRLGDRLFNFFLLRDGRRFTLVDGGLPGHAGQLRGVLGALGGGLSDIEAVLVTHGHLDHLGLVEKVRRQASATVYVHPADGGRAARGGAQLPPPGLMKNAWRPTPFAILATGALRGIFFGASIRQFTPLEPGPLDVPGRPEVLHVPGHTAGSVAFWLAEQRALLAGDALVTLDMIHGGATPPRLAPRGTHDDWPEAIESLAVFEDLGRAVVLGGHGDPWQGDMAEAVRGARAAEEA